jgi:hypothetical protein
MESNNQGKEEVWAVQKPKKAKKNKKEPKAKKPKKVHIKKYVCYNENCKEEFEQWKIARDHMIQKHEIKDPKLKKSIIYLDTKGEPKAPPKGAPKMVPHPMAIRKKEEEKKEQRDTIKLRESPKVLATPPGIESIEEDRGNDLGQFGPDWVTTWGKVKTFPHMQLPHDMSNMVITPKIEKMGNPQQSSLRPYAPSWEPGRMFRD